MKVIQSVLDEQVDEPALAREAARKYARRLAGLEWPEFRRNWADFSPGVFSYDTLTRRL